MNESFRDALTKLINQYSMEGGSNTPDFILAMYLSLCLQAFDDTVTRRDVWYGYPPGDKTATDPTAPRVSANTQE